MTAFLSAPTSLLRATGRAGVLFLISAALTAHASFTTNPSTWGLPSSPVLGASFQPRPAGAQYPPAAGYNYMGIPPTWVQYEYLRPDGSNLDPGGLLFSGNPGSQIPAGQGSVFDRVGTWTIRVWNMANPSNGVHSRGDIQCQVTLTVGAPNFTVTAAAYPTAFGSVSPTSSSVTNGGSAALRASAGSNYKFAWWADGSPSGTVLSTSGQGGASSSYTVSNVTSSRTIYAVFQNKNTFPLSTSASPGGAGSVDPTSGTNFMEGTYASPSASANYGWYFTGWTGDASGSNPNTSVYMDRAKAVTANFAPNTYTLSTSATGSGTVSGGGPYKYGSTATINATSATGWRFSGWTGASTDSNSSTTIFIDRDKTVTANFVQNVANVSVANASYEYDGSAKTLAVSTAPGGLSYSLAYNGSAAAPSAVGTYTVVATITDPNYTGSGTGTLAITPKPVAFGASPLSFTYNRSAQGPAVGNPGGATYTISGTPTGTNAGNYAFTVTATGNYVGANTFNWSIARYTPGISWPKPAGITYPAGLSSEQLNAIARDAVGEVRGSYEFTPRSGTVLDAGLNQPLGVTFTPADTANYSSPVAAGTTIDVSPKSVGFTFDPTSFIYNRSAQGPTIGNPLGATYTVTGTQSATNTGTYAFAVTATGNYTGSSRCDWSIGRATPTITWPGPAPITHPTALSALQLNASASDRTGAITGTFDYVPAIGTVLNPGNGQSLKVTFTPGDVANYRSANASTSIDVSPAGQIVRITPPGVTITAGDTVVFTASGGNNGYLWGDSASGDGTEKRVLFSLPGPFRVSAFSPAGGVYQQSNTATSTVTANPATQSVSLSPATAVIAPGQPVTLTAEGGKNGYVWGDAVSGAGTTKTVSFEIVGTYAASVYSPAGGSFAASNVASSQLTVAYAQTIDFPPPGSFVLRAVGTPLLASASSGLPVRFTVVTGPGALTSPTYLKFGTIGAILVQADQDGDATHQPAPPVRRTVIVNTAPDTTLQFPTGKTGLIHAAHQDTNLALPQDR